MNARFNWPAAATLVICIAVWGAVAASSLKLGDIYAHRGPSGFRHALMARLEHHLRGGEPKALSVDPEEARG